MRSVGPAIERFSLVQVCFAMSFSLELEADDLPADFSETEGVEARPGSVIPNLHELLRTGAVDRELVASAAGGDEDEEFDEEDFDDDFDDDFEDELDDELNDDLDEFDEDIEQSEELGEDAEADDEDADAAFGDEGF